MIKIKDEILEKVVGGVLSAADATALLNYLLANNLAVVSMFEQGNEASIIVTQITAPALVVPGRYATPTLTGVNVDPDNALDYDNQTIPGHPNLLIAEIQ